MKIYKIRSDDKNYKELSLDSLQLFDKLQLDPEGPGLIDCANLGQGEEKFPHQWKKIAVEFEASPEYPGAVKIPNISVWLGTAMVFSEKAHAFLKLVLKDDGEFLPIDFKGDTYYIFNLLKKGKIDEGKSVYRWQEGIAMDLVTRVFDEQDMQDQYLFQCTHNGYGGIYCTEEFKQDCNNFELDGLLFDEDISNIY